MKLKKLCFGFAILSLFVLLIPANAQTFSQDLTGTITDEPVMCLSNIDGEPKITGYWVYHVVFHVDQKTNEVTRIHWNVKQSHLEDQFGNTYKLIDVANDNYGGAVDVMGGVSSYDFWNNINLFNTGYDIVYDVEDGWIEHPNTSIYEGTFTSNFKVIGKHGEKVTVKDVMVYQINAHGEVMVDFDRMTIDCN